MFYTLKIIIAIFFEKYFGTTEVLPKFILINFENLWNKTILKIMEIFILTKDISLNFKTEILMLLKEYLMKKYLIKKFGFILLKLKN